MTHILMWMSLSEDMTDMAGEYNIRMDNEERAGEWENRGGEEENRGAGEWENKGGEERAGAIAGFRNVGTAARFQYR